ncbi:hypothetical protein RRG08_058548 [Elysia crispata]|uniref:PiggyBac transposable element-derived protein domain-containing protein n=1 Tax=Elysia crispata TaxID=231223 RepID=A0AAE1DY11_9GAST|nr:hypothetical protein RRG08_058548 [Elysia crispata]
MDSQQTGPSSSNSRANQRGRNIFEALRNNESDEDDDFDIDHESDRSSDFSADEDEQNNFDEDWHEVTPNGEQNRVGDIPNFTYLPNKRHARFGIKKFELCDSNGYTFHIDLYAGKELDVQHQEGQAFAVVQKLMRESNLLGKGYHLYTDNFYTKPKLAEYLSSNRTVLCGTVRANSKGLPPNITNRLAAPRQQSDLLVPLHLMSTLLLHLLSTLLLIDWCSLKARKSGDVLSAALLSKGNAPDTGAQPARWGATRNVRQSCSTVTIWDYDYQENDVHKTIRAKEYTSDTWRVNKEINESGGLGIAKDGTTRRKVKTKEINVLLSNGRHYSLGFSSLPSETGEAIKSDVETKLEELAAVADDSNFKEQILRKRITHQRQCC